MAERAPTERELLTEPVLFVLLPRRELVSVLASDGLEALFRGGVAGTLSVVFEEEA